MRDFIYLDSEFNDEQVLCFSCDDGNQRFDFDTRTDEGVEKLSAFIAEHFEDIFVAYSIAAEIESLLRLGIRLPQRWVDCLPEAIPIVCTHPQFRILEVETDDRFIDVNPKTPSLLVATSLLCGIDGDAAQKDAMRKLILSRQEWSDEEFSQILDYCASDADLLKPLWRAIREFHERVSSPWCLDDALYRGKTILNVTRKLHEGSGFPVDRDWLADIYKHRVEIIHADVDAMANRYEGFELLTKTPEGAKPNLAEIERFARAHNLPWQLSEKSQRPMLRDDFLSPFVKEIEGVSDEDFIDPLNGFSKACPSLKYFKESYDLILQLRKDPWTQDDPKRYRKALIQNGHVKAHALSFGAKSGRDLPLLNRGHILQARPFIRTIIRAPEGKTLFIFDWSKQEVGIALAFFPDRALRAAYESEDIYLTLAKLAGAVPEDATEDTHAFERQQFKSVQLGLAYGMGPQSLGRKMFADLNASASKLVITRDEAEQRAEEIYEWHKDTFHEYWEAVEDFVEQTRDRGWFMSAENWLYFADDETPTTQLQNIPMQSNGAAMMHFALNALAKTEIDFLAEHHDALYVLCDAEDADTVEAKVTEIMNNATAAVIGDDIRIAIGTKRLNAGDKYYDPRAKGMVEKLNNLIEGI